MCGWRDGGSQHTQAVCASVGRQSNIPDLNRLMMSLSLLRHVAVTADCNSVFRACHIKQHYVTRHGFLEM